MKPNTVERLSDTHWQGSAPSNIALIKYMGKQEVLTSLRAGNMPTNTSISFTLNNLRSFVELESTDASHDSWQPLTRAQGRSLTPLTLSAHGADRFLKHLQMMKKEFGFAGSFIVRSANDFPSDCGLASSASSFAALTKVAARALADLTARAEPDLATVADLSRRGSGSSCRSFFAPWSIWRRDGSVGDVEALSDLAVVRHLVVVVDDEKKAVSSSEAHKRVVTSLLFTGRAERAEQRCKDLVEALATRNWRSAFETSWAEFFDMHALFETSRPSFGYMTSASHEVVQTVRRLFWMNGEASGPLVTMDAGANVHLLFCDVEHSEQQVARARKALESRFRLIETGGSGQ